MHYIKNDFETIFFFFDMGGKLQAPRFFRKTAGKHTKEASLSMFSMSLATEITLTLTTVEWFGPLMSKTS